MSSVVVRVRWESLPGRLLALSVAAAGRRDHTARRPLAFAPGWAGLLASVLLHAAAVLALPPLASLLTGRAGEVVPQLRLLPLEPLTIRVRERVYFQPGAAGERRAVAQTHRRFKLPALPQPAHEAPAALNTPAWAPELPWLPHRPASTLPVPIPDSPLLASRPVPEALPGASAAILALHGSASGSAPPIRIEHPADGVFDVVLQAAGVDGQPDATGLLSGQPVYTVYLAVGGPQDWILHYCLAAASSVQSGGVVQLAAADPLEPPYPRVTFIPAAAAFVGNHRTLLRGTLGTAGRFGPLHPARPEDAGMAETLAPFLQQWQFRPARQQDSPIEVEVLLSIPAAGS